MFAAGDSGQLGDDLMLNTASERPAAQHKGIDIDREAYLSIKHRTYEAVVDESVAYVHDLPQQVTGIAECFDVISSAPNGRQVELICSLDQLGNARKMLRRHRSCFNLK